MWTESRSYPLFRECCPWNKHLMDVSRRRRIQIFLLFIKHVGDLPLISRSKSNGGWGNTCFPTKFPGTVVPKCWLHQDSLEGWVKHRLFSPTPEFLGQWIWEPKHRHFQLLHGSCRWCRGGDHRWRDCALEKGECETQVVGGGWASGR